jgi:L-threonylcarbamoyladenylate synthase
VTLSKSSVWRVQYAAEVIRAGGLVAHPTEAVWGLACDPFNEQAVSSLLNLKKRPRDKGMILVSGCVEHFYPLLDALPPELQRRFMLEAECPTTWLVPDVYDIVPPLIKGRFSSVALRLSRHPLTVALSKRLDSPLVSTSANPAGKPPAKNLREVRRYFYQDVDYLLDGRLGGYSKPSVIRDLVSGDAVRS